MINARKERHGPVEVANPDLGGAGVEIEGAFLVGLGRGIRWGKNLDANVWRASQDNGVLVNFGPAWSEPGDIDGLDAVCGGHWTLCKDEAVREQIGQQSADGKLAASMTKSWRRAYEDVSVPIGLDPIGQLGEDRIGQDFGPTSQVEFGLRSEIRELDSDRHELEESMKVASKQRGKRVRTLAIGCLSGIVLLWAVCQAGLRINGTHSEPVGIYWAVSKPPAKGDFVFVEPPAEPIFKLARERGYLGAGFGPAGTCALIKRVAAAAGDRITIDNEGVWVNGVRLKNSAPRPADEAGRPLRPYYLREYTLGANEVLVMSDYSAASFDGRYFGPLSKTTIQSVIVPILTWK